MEVSEAPRNPLQDYFTLFGILKLVLVPISEQNILSSKKFILRNSVYVFHYQIHQPLRRSRQRRQHGGRGGGGADVAAIGVVRAAEAVAEPSAEDEDQQGGGQVGHQHSDLKHDVFHSVVSNQIRAWVLYTNLRYFIPLR